MLLLIGLNRLLVNLGFLLNNILLMSIVISLAVIEVITLMIVVKLIDALLLLLNVPFVGIFGKLKVVSGLRVLDLLG